LQNNVFKQLNSRSNHTKELEFYLYNQHETGTGVVEQDMLRESRIQKRELNALELPTRDSN